MKKKPASPRGFFSLRILISFGLSSVGVLALLGLGVYSGSSAVAAGPQQKSNVIFGSSYHNDVSPALRDLPQGFTVKQRHEGPENPRIPNNHKDMPDTVVQDSHVSALALLAPHIPQPILNFDGIPFPGVNCNCAPPDTNGDVGTTQYVQIVNTGYEVFDKATGNSVLGPNSIESIWSGFGGLCQTSGFGDPVVVFDQIARRWVVTQFAGTSIPTDYCIAVSTTDDATGTYNRYGFHIGSNFIDYPKIGVWPDAYYVSVNLFNSSGTAFLGPQPFAFDRAKMLVGDPATFVSFPALGSNTAPFLPSDQDGNIKARPGAPNTFLGWPQNGTYTVYHFHVDFVTPTNSTFTVFANPPAAPFAQACPVTFACAPELGVSPFDYLEVLGDRLMHRLAYRNFGRNEHEAVVGTYDVLANGRAAPRWFEIRNVTDGPVEVFQESTYQPDTDTDWRWMGSACMDKRGNLALGFSASSPDIHPQIRYAGRLRKDPLNTLAQGEAHLFDGAGSQTDTVNRWGDYSCLAIDPVDDRTFWYTTQYYQTTSSFNWRTRIGNFKFEKPPPP